MKSLTFGDIFTKKNSVAFLLIIVLIGVLMIIFSDDNDETNEASLPTVFDEKAYEENLEKRLKTIVEEIEGVGEVSVMVTLEGSALYSYATDVTSSTEADGDSKRESTIVLQSGASSSKEAVISGYELPKVKGAAVVSSNRLTETLRAKVIGVVSAALGVSSAKICVTN